ncbi:MAG: condensation domain-containing protein [Alphaproteobacteria bacterium]|nr:condensation domain-containing protein [Alphaproteobacteria bacterium]
MSRQSAPADAHSPIENEFEDYACSLAQTRLWNLERLDPGGASRNIAARWRLEGRCDPAILRAALTAIAARHEILRTVFVGRGDGVEQRVLASAPPAFAVVDLTHLTPDDREARAIAIGESEARKSFDLTSAPPWTVTLIVLGADRAILLITLHSIICDGWSIGLLARELGMTAEALAEGRRADLPELPLQYVDYSLWQQDYLDSPAFAQQRDYWMKALAEAPMLDLPTDHVRPERSGGNGRIVSRLLHARLIGQVEEECRGVGVSLFTAAAAALTLVLRARADADEFVIGTQVAGRDVVDLEDLVGPLSNTVMLRLEAGGDPTLRVLLKRIGETVREALIHQGAPFECITEQSGCFAPGRRPYGVNLILQRSFIQNARYGAMELADLPSHASGALYNLSFFMIGRPEGWRISCEFDSDLFDHASVEEMLEGWQAALNAIATTPQTRLHALDPSLRRSGSAPRDFPCTPPQRRCWFLDQLNPGSAALNVPVMWEVRGAVSGEQVEAALRLVVARHEILRTAIVETDKGPAQRPLGAVAFHLAQIDISSIAESDRAGEIDRLRRLDAQKPFDLTAPPLMRASLARSSPVVAHLILTVHQGVFDGWSIRVITQELGLCLQALLEQRRPDMPMLGLQYADYAQQQLGKSQSASYEDDKAYWLRQLDRAPYFEVPPDRQRGKTRSTRSATDALAISKSAGEGLEDAAKAVGVSTFTYGCASLGATLHLLTGAEDIVVGTQAAGRREVDHEPLIGVFINNLVLRLRPRAECSFKSYLEGADGVIRDALAHQDMPFDNLVELLNPPRDAARTPLISVNVVVRRSFLESARFGDIELAPAPAAPTDALYDLTFELVRRGDQWRVSVEYNCDLYDAATARRMLVLWQAVIEASIADPSAPLSRLAPAPKRLPITPEDPVAAPARRIEQALLLSPSVAEAVVTTIEDAGGNAAFYAYVSPRPDLPSALEALPGDLLDEIAARLPPDLRPLGISVVMRLPRLQSGLVDPGALPSPRPHARPVESAHPAAAEIEMRASEIETELRAIWMRRLAIEAADSSANFFELGGHSLLAMRMLSDVRGRFGTAPPVAALFREPTLRGFAQEIAALVSISRPASPPGGAAAEILFIQPRGDRTPIFAINNTVIYYNLARAIGQDRPFIGVQMFDPERPRPMQPQSLEQIASEFVAAIREIRPNGPYILMGLCVSGAIAYEVGRQLRAAGEAVPLIVQADAGRPNHLAASPFPARVLHAVFYRARVLGRHVARLASGRSSLANVIGSYDVLKRIGFTPLAIRMGWVKEQDLGEGWRNLWFLPFLLEARDRYAPQAFDGDMALLLSDEVDTRFIDPELGWRSHIKGRLIATRAPGWHAEMFSGAGAGVIADALSPLLRAIDDASATARTPQ